jgi:hypothetical protein
MANQPTRRTPQFPKQRLFQLAEEGCESLDLRVCSTLWRHDRERPRPTTWLSVENRIEIKRRGKFGSDEVSVAAVLGAHIAAPREFGFAKKNSGDQN